LSLLGQSSARWSMSFKSTQIDRAEFDDLRRLTVAPDLRQ